MNLHYLSLCPERTQDNPGLSWLSCVSSLRKGRCPAEPVPALDLDMDSAPRPLLDGDDRNAVEAGDSLRLLSFHKDVDDSNEEQEVVSFTTHGRNTTHPADRQGSINSAGQCDAVMRASRSEIQTVTNVSSWSSVSLQVEPPWMDSMAVEYKALCAACLFSSPPAAGEP
ncbi:hypothetical protein EYF80_011664 [Liparis tanakae]|uniref:Uncharacterized protein n=1 Tax=Liparis tanakae TaxID=230148 RepID=A0A4Z2IJK3_9TELE|nr:hypothetical protein EYF80_011664 [Liparis tanakae]